MEFFLGNALTRIFAAALPGAAVELVAPEWALLRSRKVAFPQVLDSLNLPWEKWLPEDAETLLYRPRESMAAVASKQKLDKVAGALGMTHVLVVRGFRVDVGPKSSSNHVGSLNWKWSAALYNATQGRFEWAVTFSEQRTFMDLDDDLEPALTKTLSESMHQIPGALDALLKSEPR